MGFPKKFEYHLLGEEEEKGSRSRPGVLNDDRIWLRWRTIGASLAVAMLLAIASSTILYFSWHSTQGRETIIKSCGSSAAEARSLGCTYDIMMDSWLPPNCYDEELSNEFRGLRDWAMYADKNGTHRLTLEELSEREFHAFAHTTIEYHYIHCLFSWRKFHRALEQGRDIEREVAELGHTNHCAWFVAKLGHRLEDPGDLPSLQKIGTKLPVAFPTCVSIADVVKRRP
jgi:hypothetical protein